MAPVPEDATEPDPQTDEQEQASVPLPLIVTTRAPDRPTSKIVGDLSPQQASLGAVVTFGITPVGRHSELAAQVHRRTAKDAANLHALPHPRLQPLPTRVATSTPLDGHGSDDD